MAREAAEADARARNDIATLLALQHQGLIDEHTETTETGYRKLKSLEAVIGEVEADTRKGRLDSYFDSALRTAQSYAEAAIDSVRSSRNSLESERGDLSRVRQRMDADFDGAYRAYKSQLEQESETLRKSIDMGDFDARNQLEQNDKILALDPTTAEGQAEIKAALDERIGQVDGRIQQLTQRIADLERMRTGEGMDQKRSEVFGKNKGYRLKGETEYEREFNSILDQFEQFMSIWYGTDYALRQNQVEELFNYMNNPGSLDEIPMGWGKTDVLLPLLPRVACQEVVRAMPLDVRTRHQGGRSAGHDQDHVSAGQDQEGRGLAPGDSDHDGHRDRLSGDAGGVRHGAVRDRQTGFAPQRRQRRNRSRQPRPPRRHPNRRRV